ncbi:hypothetical protein ACFLRC_02220 [Candidatus Altiarchaeota archaeon]
MNLLKGHHILPRDTKDFYKVCKELDKEFNGTIRLIGILDKVLYQADLLIEKGSVRGSSFEALGGKKILYGEDAMAAIRDKLVGSSGRLDIYRFDDRDMKTAVEDNKEALVKSVVKLSEIGVKIKSIKPKEVVSTKKPVAAVAGGKDVRHSRMFGLGKITSLFSSRPSTPRAEREKRLKKTVETAMPHRKDNTQKKIPQVAGLSQNAPGGKAAMKKAERAKEIQKNRLQAVIANPTPDAAAETLSQQPLPQPQQQQKAGLMSAVAGGMKSMTDRKRERMEQIQRRRIVKVIQKPPEEEPKIKVKSFEAGEKVETSIDKLYELVHKYKTLKVDDRLARALKVSKTQIEEWAMILEEHNLLELHYPTIGEPEIKYVPRGKEKD